MYCLNVGIHISSPILLGLAKNPIYTEHCRYIIMCICHMKMIYYLGKSFENPSLSISYTLKNIKIDNVAGSTLQ